MMAMLQSRGVMTKVSARGGHTGARLRWGRAGTTRGREMCTGRRRECTRGERLRREVAHGKRLELSERDMRERVRELRATVKTS